MVFSFLSNQGFCDSDILWLMMPTQGVHKSSASFGLLRAPWSGVALHPPPPIPLDVYPLSVLTPFPPSPNRHSRHDSCNIFRYIGVENIKIKTIFLVENQRCLIYPRPRLRLSWQSLDVRMNCLRINAAANGPRAYALIIVKIGIMMGKFSKWVCACHTSYMTCCE
jgi:hypothetical protein